MRYFSIIFMLLLLSGCSSVPLAIQDRPQPDITLKELTSNTSKYKNLTVRWGGKIVKVENDNFGSTIQIVQLPLKSFGRPDRDQYKQSGGRFAVVSNTFLDPQIYQQDSLVTISGTLTGERKIIVDKREMVIPVVTMNEVHLWTENKQTEEELYFHRRYHLDPYWSIRRGRYYYFY